MRRVIKMLVFVAAAAIVNLPTVVRAEGYINPWAGINFAGDPTPQKGFHTFGVSAGDTGSKAGLDINFGYTNHYVKADSKVVDLMVGLTAGPQLGNGAQSARPYVVGGVGLLRSGSGDFADNNFGFNVGGGVFLFFTDNIGIRGEVRYFRALNGGDLLDFHFTRAQLGIVIR